MQDDWKLLRHGSHLLVNEWGMLCYWHERHGQLVVHALADEPRQELGRWTHSLYNGAFLIPNDPGPPF